MFMHHIKGEANKTDTCWDIANPNPNPNPKKTKSKNCMGKKKKLSPKFVWEKKKN